MTKITFLGTGGDNYLTSKCIRLAGGIVIEHEELQFHIDPGPNSLLSARKNDINPRATTAVICTSADLLHSNDLNIMVKAMTHDGLDIKGIIVGTSSVIETKPPFLLSQVQKSVERIMIVEPEKKIGIEDVDIHFTKSTIEDVVGIKMYFPSLTIGYSSDTGYNDKIGGQYEGCDILILNVLHPRGVRKKDTLSSDDAIRFIKKVKPQLAVLTHFGKQMLEQDPIQEARYIHAETKVQVMAAIDGQMIQPTSYSANSKQKSLKSF